MDNGDSLEINFDKKFKNDLGRKKIILFVVIIISSLLSTSIFSNGDYFDSIILATITVVSIYFLKNIYAQTCYLQEYIPQKGYKFYRKSSNKRMMHYTVIQIILSLFAIIGIYNNTYGSAINVALAIIYIQIMMKKRIKLHEPIDDAMYFELEEMDIINSGNIVKALYKDFENWENLKENKKVLLVTQDNFICVNFKNRFEADKYVFPLSQIDKLGILRTGNYKEGFLITIGCNNKLMKIRLAGDSFQDSPEEFISFFISELDRCKLGIKDTNKRNENSVNVNKIQSEVLQDISIREIDFVIDNNKNETKSDDNIDVKSKNRCIDL
jgi:hypothetical protein